MQEKRHGYGHNHVSLKSFTEWKEFFIQECLIPVYFGSTFFTGIPQFNKFPLGLLNWSLLYFFGSIKWKHGESVVAVL